ncbi:MAG: hypothetical protein WBV55_01210 [Candidatus Sulfotelmatobacter sp.]
MKSQEIEMFSALIRRCQVMRAERMALVTILKRYALINEAPTNWKADLDLIRESADYRKIVQELDSMLARLLEDTDLRELQRLCEQLGDDKPPN